MAAATIAELLLGAEMKGFKGQIYDFMDECAGADELMNACRTDRERQLAYALIAYDKRITQEMNPLDLVRFFWLAKPEGDEINDLSERYHSENGGPQYDENGFVIETSTEGNNS